MLKYGEHLLDEGRYAEPVDLGTIQKLRPEASVLEFGPGLGFALPALQRAVPQGRVVVVDQCPEVMTTLQASFRGPSFVFAQGKRPGDSGQAPSSIDYVRARRVLPYLDEQGLADFMSDSSELLKPGGSLFFTAHHPSQSDMLLFRTHSVEAITTFASRTPLKVESFEVAVISTEDRKTREVLQFDLADATPERMKEIDSIIASRGDVGGEFVELEMRFHFRKPGGDTPLPQAEE
jgi:SAM-dependent methyltransferase